MILLETTLTDVPSRPTLEESRLCSIPPRVGLYFGSFSDRLHALSGNLTRIVKYNARIVLHQILS